LARTEPAGPKAWKECEGAYNANGNELVADPGDDTAEHELLASLACDAQTSGGLLLCVPADRAASCVEGLRSLGLPAAQIGELLDPTEGVPPIELR